MKLSPNHKRNLYRIIPFGLIWFTFGLIYAFLEKGLLNDLTYYPSTGNPYNFKESFPVYIVSVVIAGLAMGSFEVLFLSKRFTRRNFSQKLVLKTSIYLVLICMILITLSSFTNAIDLDKSILSSEVLNNIYAYVSNFAFLTTICFVASILVISLFFNEVSDNIGQEVLRNFITGKYHRPIQEDRVFMFLDMKSSTTIAEKIGHVRYFAMLQDYYSDLSDPVIQYSGEIYQYVGDEMIISWKLAKGLQKENCLRCFFAMQNQLNKNSQHYLQKFEVMPSFKAGLHYGTVTAGEIGKIKKDIIFTGDVLNTTARIQGLCNSLETEILVSGPLKNQFENDNEFNWKSMGLQELKGKQNKVELFSVTYHGSIN